MVGLGPGSRAIERFNKDGLQNAVWSENLTQHVALVGPKLVEVFRRAGASG
jgi:hypothetical protein